MKLKSKKRLLNELAKECESPKDFIYAVMSLQDQPAEDVVKTIDMTSTHFYVAMSQLGKGQSIGTKTCAKIV